MEEKLCARCGEYKILTAFDRNKHRTTGRESYCKDCRRLYNRTIRGKASAMVSDAKTRANKRGLPFDITIDDVCIPSICPILGIPLMFGDGTANDNSPQLDRIIPDLGYVKGNIQVISAKANRIKSNATQAEIKMVLEWFEKQLGTDT